MVFFGQIKIIAMESADLFALGAREKGVLHRIGVYGTTHLLSVSIALTRTQIWDEVNQ